MKRIKIICKTEIARECIKLQAEEALTDRKNKISMRIARMKIILTPDILTMEFQNQQIASALNPEFLIKTVTDNMIQNGAISGTDYDVIIE